MVQKLLVALPQGLQFWEWMQFRLGTDISMQSRGAELQVCYHGPGFNLVPQSQNGKVHNNAQQPSTTMDASEERQEQLLAAIEEALLSHRQRWGPSEKVHLKYLHKLPAVQE